MNINGKQISKETFFNSIIDTISDGVTVIDRDFKILYQNSAMINRFGSLLGKRCFSGYRGHDEPCDGCMIHDVLNDGKIHKGLKDVCCEGSGIMWCEYTGGPLKDENGTVIGAIEVVRDVSEQIRITQECVSYRKELEKITNFQNIITQSKKMKSVLNLVKKIAPTSSSVLMSGESGTGKEVLAKSIVANSDRKDKAFLTINCGAIPEALIESELFGHVKGSFTGANKDKKGLIAEAHEGTLFLDEIGELPFQMQVKLLRFLQESEVRPVGSTKTEKYDVRIIAATNRNLEEEVKNGTFREDLFFRLNVIPIHLPPLRERIEDIPILAAHLFQNLCDIHNRNLNGISPEALKLFMEYPWPGNVRELENTIEYAIHLANDHESIKTDHLPDKILRHSQKISVNPSFYTIDEYTKRAILALQSEYNEKEIAEKLGISRKSLWEKRKKWEIERVDDLPE